MGFNSGFKGLNKLLGYNTPKIFYEWILRNIYKSLPPS